MEFMLAKISIMLVPALLAVTLHEVAHGFVADKLGDPTARLLGRLTLNPLKHLDPIGTLALLIFGFGWARPVPVNYHNLKDPRPNMILVSLAGPTINLLLATLSGLFLRALLFLPPEWIQPGSTLVQVLEPLALMAGFSLYINAILGVFNLIPLPPLDGGRVLAGILPPRQAAMLARIEPFGFIIILLLVFFTDIWRILVGPVIMHLVAVIAGPQVEIVNQAMSFLFGR